MNGLSYCEQASQIVFEEMFKTWELFLKKHPDWVRPGAPLFLLCFHSQLILVVHSMPSTYTILPLFSLRNSGLDKLSWVTAFPYRDYHLYQYHLTCDVQSMRYTESPSIDILWLLITEYIHRNSKLLARSLCF